MGRTIAYLRRVWLWPAFFLVLFGSAGVIWFYLDPGQPDQPGRHRLEAENRQYQAGDSACAPERLNRPSGKEAAAQRENCEEAAEEHRLKQNDLVQQTRSADAAETVAELSFAQTRALAVGALLGLLTLAAASVAAYFAREAAKETKRSADTAERTLIGLERPLLNVEVVYPGSGIYGSESFSPPTIRLVNHGRAAALLVGHIVILSANEWASHPSDESLEPPVQGGGLGSVILGPGNHSPDIPCGQYSAPSGEAMAWINEDWKANFLWGFVWYEDTIGSMYERRFCFWRLKGEYIPYGWQNSPEYRAKFNYDRRIHPPEPKRRD